MRKSCAGLANPAYRLPTHATINGRANTIGTYEVFFGDYNKLFDAAKNYSAVTKEDLLRVAKAYFGANNRTVATLLPEEAQKAAQ